MLTAQERAELKDLHERVVEAEKQLVEANRAQTAAENARRQAWLNLNAWLSAHSAKEDGK